MKKLRGPEINRLQREMLKSFPNPNDLDTILRKRIDRSLPGSSSGDYEERLFQLIHEAEREEWMVALLVELNLARQNVRAFYDFICSWLTLTEQMLVRLFYILHGSEAALDKRAPEAYRKSEMKKTSKVIDGTCCVLYYALWAAAESNEQLSAYITELSPKASKPVQLALNKWLETPRTFSQIEVTKHTDAASVSIKKSSGERSFEGIVREGNWYIDGVFWAERKIEYMPRVCRLEIKYDAGKVKYGTGFLIAPDQILTNYHVIEDLFEQPDLYKTVNVKFDFYATKTGIKRTPNRALHKKWCTHFRPYSKKDLQIRQANDSGPASDDLDYAVLRLCDSPGAERIETPFGKQVRGWFDLKESEWRMVKDEPLLIIQHPSGNEMKLALDFNSIIELNTNETRVLYRTNTDGGSSGSPCFDFQWNLVAVHHNTELIAKNSNLARFNEGIPIGKIFENLKASKKFKFEKYRP